MKQSTKIVICGPTASGKSLLAVKLATKLGGEIINADSLQVYRELPILTAQPTEEEMKIVPHHLYGVLNGDEVFNVGKWLEMIPAPLPETAIFVGGTGMYLNALFNGLSEIPEIPDEIRNQVRKMQIDEVAEALGSKADGNNHRMRRRLEVALATGKDIDEFHSNQQKSSADDFVIFNIVGDRQKIYQNINLRFDLMLENGAIEEVKELLKKSYESNLTVMKACGTPQIIDYIDGKISLENAIEKAKQISRNYAKRQMTWFRNQLPMYKIDIDPSDENALSKMLENVK